MLNPLTDTLQENKDVLFQRTIQIVISMVFFSFLCFNLTVLDAKAATNHLPQNSLKQSEKIYNVNLLKKTEHPMEHIQKRPSVTINNAEVLNSIEINQPERFSEILDKPLNQFDEEAEEERIILFISAVIGLLLIASLVGIVTNRLRLPYTVGLVLIGLVLSFRGQENISIPPEIFLGLLVPPLVF